MRVLVTGGAGFIGSPVCRVLVEHGHEVRVLDRAAGPDSSEVRGDVRDRAAVDAALADVDVVCHLAAKVGLGVDVQDLPDYTDVNVTGTAVVLAAMARASVRRLVLASSMVVYGEGLGRCAEHGVTAPAPRRDGDLRAGRFDPPCPRCGQALHPHTVAEDAPLDPRNGYAISKLAQEQLAAAWARETSGSVAALRYHNVYGPGMPRDTPYAGVAAIFRSELLAGRAPRVFEDGRQRRDFVHVRDIASATVAATEEHHDGVLALNVGSGVPRTVGDMADALSAATGGPSPVITGEYRTADVRHIVADSALLRQTFRWRPQVDFAAGVSELVTDEDAPGR